MITSLFESRFILDTDPKQINFFFNNILSNQDWISRPYEYTWATSFLNQNHVVLDAACGICHPLKFFLSDIVREVHACDMDSRILSKDKILTDVLKTFGSDAINKLNDKHFSRISYSQCNLTKLPYHDNFFDQIFCISVLEHLNDFRNNHSEPYKIIKNIPSCAKFFHYDIKKTLLEFKRTLKDNGVIILTFDFPRINLEYLNHLIEEIGLSFYADASFDIPKNALYRKDKKLYFFRALLKKRN